MAARLRRVADPRRLAIVFVIGLALFVVDNVYWLVRNQTERSCPYYKVCVSPRGIEAVMRKSTNPKVAFLANWHFLNGRIADARLTIPPSLASQKWYLEHLARLHVEVSEKPFLIDPDQIQRLRTSSTDRRELPWWHNKRVRSDLYLRFNATASDYVLAEANDSDGPVFVMARSEYASVAAR